MEQSLTESVNLKEQEVSHFEGDKVLSEKMREFFWTELVPEINKHQIIQRWDSILLNLRQQYDVSAIAFDTFLSPLKVFDVDESGDRVRLFVSAEAFLCPVIEKKYRELLQISIEAVTGLSCDVQFFAIDTKAVECRQG